MLNTLKKYVLDCKSYDLEESLLIFADPRSGSTWLSEIISKYRHSCIIDEPLHLNNDKKLRDMRYGWRQHIPKNSLHPESDQYFNNLFCGKDVKPIHLHKNTLSQILMSKDLLFKIIRGKMLLPFILNKLSFRYKPIFLIRHPLAVLYSMKLHSAWSFDFIPFEVPDTIFNDIYQKHSRFMSSLNSHEEIMLSFWCLGNHEFFISSLLKEKCDIVFYEDLVVDPKITLSKLSVFKDKKIRRRDYNFSSQTVGSSYKTDIEKQISKWKNHFTQEQLKSFQSIMDYFKIAVYDTEKLTRH